MIDSMRPPDSPNFTPASGEGKIRGISSDFMEGKRTWEEGGTDNEQDRSRAEWPGALTASKVAVALPYGLWTGFAF